MLPVAISVIGLSFVIAKHRNSINLAAVAATTVLSAAFTLASTLGVAHVLGVSSGELQDCNNWHCGGTAAGPGPPWNTDVDHEVWLHCNRWYPAGSGSAVA